MMIRAPARTTTFLSQERNAIGRRDAIGNDPPLMRRPTTPALRIIAASRLRAWADRLEPPPVPVRAQPVGAPLVRLGRRWWSRDELVGGRDG
jgi:hypothetical protein